MIFNKKDDNEINEIYNTLEKNMTLTITLGIILLNTLRIHLIVRLLN